MHDIILPGTSIKLSKFIFGTASLSAILSKRQRLDLLYAAADHGFTHFDTAPYYGFGMAERDLAALIKQKPNLTITTKVGLYSPGGEDQSSSSVLLRKSIGRVFSNISRPKVDFSIKRANFALEGSLRRLGREVVDIYTLHEPELRLLNTDEWQRWLEKMVSDGKVRNFGIALTSDKLKPFLEAKSKLSQVIQTADSLRSREADILSRYQKPFQITYGYVSAEQRSGGTLPVKEILKQAILRNCDGAIIVTTKKISRLQQYADLKMETDVA